MAFSHRWKVAGDRHREVPAQLQAELCIPSSREYANRISPLFAYPERSDIVGSVAVMRPCSGRDDLSSHGFSCLRMSAPTKVIASEHQSTRFI